MLGIAALSELPLSTSEPSSASASAAAAAVADVTASGAGAVNVSHAPVALGVVSVSGQGGVAFGGNAFSNATAAAQGVGRADAERKIAGYAVGVTTVFAIGRAEPAAIVAVAQTRVLATLAVSVEVLPVVATARSLVLAQPSATSAVLGSPAVVATEPLADVVAAARVEH